MTLIYCGCGCGEQREEFDSRGRSYKYIKGHWGNGKHRSEKTKQKLSEITKGKISPRKGTFCTEEQKKKMSVAHVGLQSGEKHPLFGKHHSEKTKKKISDANKGHIPPNKGIPMSEEQKKKLYKGGRKLTKTKCESKRRSLGFDLINNLLNDDDVAHHITRDFVAYVPEYINRSMYHSIWSGKNMDKINFFALNYLFLIYNKEE